MSSPNAAAASRRAPATASSRSAGPRTTRIPRPPPPADALTSSGKPTSDVADTSSLHGSVGTPASRISRLAPSFDPIAAIAAAGGPTQISPAATTCSAKPAHSERNP